MGTDTALPRARIAQLAALRRLGQGTAHAMNNALTAALGETGFLLEDYKDDPEVSEACQAIQRALQRCASLSHALLTHSQPPGPAEAEVDLVRLVRDLEPWLDESIGSRRALSVEAPDDLVMVTGAPADLRLVLMVLVSFAAERGEDAEVAIRVEGGEPAVLAVDITARARAEEAVGWLGDPVSAPDPLDACSLGAARDIIAAMGGRWQVESDGPERWQVRAEMPTSS
ncbi:MAG: hypothetical protein CL910_18980 [Deltaproteobacteria bacterium]|nr:hypothetical protein [Deltaproteobacteria bacterium]